MLLAKADQTTLVSSDDLSVQYVDRQDPLSVWLRAVLGDDWVKLLLVALFIYGPVEKLILPFFGGYLNLGGGLRAWNPHIESLLTGFVEFPFFLAYYLWSSYGIMLALESLRRNDNFADEERFSAFVQRMLAAFNQSIWTVIALALAGAAVLLMHLVVWGPDTTVPAWFGDRVGARLFSLALVGLVAYAVAHIFIRETLSIIWLRRLWTELGDDLVIHPYHADGVGGLGGIGQHAVRFFFFVIMVMLFIVMGSLLPSLLQTSATAELSLRFWSPLILLIWVAYLLIVPLMLFLLLWSPHKAMERARDRKLQTFSRELDKQIKQAETGISADHSNLADILKKIGDLKQMRTVLLTDFPVWPVSVESKRFLGLTSIIPTAYSALTFVVGLFK